MSIRRILQVYTAITILFILAVVPLFVGIIKQIGRAVDAASVGYQLSKTSFDLYTLSTDYLLHPEERILTQWQITHDIMESLLRSLNDYKFFFPPEETELLRDLWKAHADIKTVFDEMTKTLSPEFTPILTTRLQTESEEVVSASSALVEFNANLINRASERISRTLAIFAAAFGFFLFGIGLFLYRKIARPIAILQEGTEKIASGDFEHAVNLASGAEFDGLATSFNAMARNLKKQSEDLQKFKLAVAGVQEHIIITDPDGIIVYANAAAEKLTGYSAREMLGKRPSLWGKQMPPDFYQKMWRVIKVDKKNFFCEVKNKKKNGQEYFANLYIAPILDARGEIRFFVGIERDLTKEKEIEKLRMDFLSLASHQLRTPLSGTKWLIETLQRGIIGTLTKKQGAYLNEIYRINERMIKLVYDMLSALRLESAESAIKKERIHVSALFPDIVAAVSMAAKERGILLRYPLNHRTLTLETDAEALKAILECFLSNAISYSSAGQEVLFDVTEEATTIIFLVKDSGIGIPKEEAGRIFERFYRASNAKVVKPEGTGLGLYIAKMLADKMGATIFFESEVDKGSTFYVRIPKSAPN